jgi:hypothetical protein
MKEPVPSRTLDVDIEQHIGGETSLYPFAQRVLNGSENWSVCFEMDFNRQIFSWTKLVSYFSINILSNTLFMVRSYRTDIMK